MTVNLSDYGKSEMTAILTHNALFALRRPRVENVISVAEALASGDVEVLGVVSRLISALP